MDLKHLKNVYYVMRHGESMANHEGLIVSNPERGVTGYGLTETGAEQAREATEAAEKNALLTDDTVIVSSDFLRARETADIAADVLGVGYVETTPKLRERSFGVYEGTSDSNYEKVWESDTTKVDQGAMAVESTADVLSRSLSLIADMEDRYQGRNILFISHGDTLQILLTAFADISPSDHRSQAHLGTAEIRKCN